MKSKDRVDFSTELQDGLHLCLGDMNAKNWIIDEGGRVVSVDHANTCYLPSSFVTYAMKNELGDAFTREVSPYVTYPKSDHYHQMQLVSWKFVTISNDACKSAFRCPRPRHYV